MQKTEYSSELTADNTLIQKKKKKDELQLRYKKKLNNINTSLNTRYRMNNEV